MAPKSLPHRLCTHLQNVSRANIAKTPLPFTESALAITSVLLRHGLISNITTGGPAEPNPAAFNAFGPAQKRLWVDMKYRNGLPVLRRISPVSKPSVRISVTREELGRILTGKRARNVGGIGIGEILVVKTPKAAEMGRVGKEVYMDGWEAWRAGLGGELLLRAS